MKALLQEQIEDRPNEVLKGAYVLLEGLGETNETGVHKHSKEAFNILEYLIADCTEQIDKEFKGKRNT